MKNNKAFTLVELLAVIVILAVILVIAVPQVLDVIDSSKIGSLESTAKIIADAAEKKYAEYLALGKDTSTIKCSDVTKLNNKDYGTCTISFDENGKAAVSIKGKGNGKFDGLSCSGTKDNMECKEVPVVPVVNCSFDGELVQGAEYVNGQYTYRYKQNYNSSSFQDFVWINIEDDGWGVTLTDKDSTEAVTSEVCTYINNKPIVSMTGMFAESKAESIDLSSFNTSNVIDMSGMFVRVMTNNLDLSSFDTSNVTNMCGMFYNNISLNINLSSFDTSKVTDMSHMFSLSAVKSLDLSSFDTSNVVNMSGMFNNSNLSNINLSSFDTSKVTDMSGMFSNSKATSLNLSSFDTSNVTDMATMFNRSAATSLNLRNFNTSKVTNMVAMFSDCTATTLDLSSFDINNVTNLYMSNMFNGSLATTGYARTQTDADKFNSSSNKPSTLTFVVKES